ncbi:efflux RND transporter periplasmic adaptor subunit, partial [bacterium]|nr:efflux RND transporter periplasmic adaptor subunit [bacterium]
PNIALKFTPETDGQKYKEQGVWVLTGNKPSRINIQQGASDDSKFEVIASSLKEGDLIITGSSNSSVKTKSNAMRRPPRMF